MLAERLGECFAVASGEAFHQNAMATRGLDQRTAMTGRPQLRTMGVEGASGEYLLQRLETGQPEDRQVKSHVEFDQAERVFTMGRRLHLLGNLTELIECLFGDVLGRLEGPAHLDATA